MHFCLKYATWRPAIYIRCSASLPARITRELRRPSEPWPNARHPDVNADSLGTEERFKEFNSAYEVLGDPARRATYDFELEQERNLRRRRFWQAAATMIVSFIVTIAVGSAAFIWSQTSAATRSSEIPASTSETALRPLSTPLEGDEQAFGYQASSSATSLPVERPDAGAAEQDTATARADVPGLIDPAAPEIHHDAEIQPSAGTSAQIALAEPPKKKIHPPSRRRPICCRPSRNPRLTTRRPLWTTYRNARSGFSLKIADAIFLRGEAAADVTENMWVSRDGRAVLHITSVPNMAGIKAAQHRRLRMQQRYGGATLDYAPEKANWFVLSGTLGEEIFTSASRSPAIGGRCTVGGFCLSGVRTRRLRSRRRG